MSFFNHDYINIPERFLVGTIQSQYTFNNILFTFEILKKLISIEDIKSVFSYRNTKFDVKNHRIRFKKGIVPMTLNFYQQLID